MRLQSFLRVLAGIAIVTGLPVRIETAAAQAPDSQGPVLRTESRLVLVDTVVTDKKGNYVHDLEAKDFKVWEDSKEQVVKSFSFEAGTTTAPGVKARYMVLFFDNSTMSTSDQMAAREAAAKFIDTNAGPERLMAIVNFGGSLRIAQNFTADAERLKQVVKGVKFSTVSPNVEVASIGAPSLGAAESEYGQRSMLLALRSLAKKLATVPGRKTLVLLSSGFPVTGENRSELTATIDQCNKANVAVYPIDARGLTAPMSAVPSNPGLYAWAQRASGVSFFLPVAFSPAAFAFQRPGGGGGGGGMGSGGVGSGSSSGGSSGSGSRGGSSGGSTGGTGSGSTGGSGASGGGKGGTGGTGSGSGGKGGTGGTGSGSGGKGGSTGSGGGGTTGGRYGNNYYNNTNPNYQPRVIIPTFPQSATTNQQLFYMLADGTGGFVIVNTNDLLGGLQKIAKEQNEYYILGYTPPESEEGSCHILKVKLERGGLNVRARSGYCNVKPVDLLAGKPEEKQLEAMAAAGAQGKYTATMRLPFFYTSANTARVNVAMEIPPAAFHFEKAKGKQHAEMNVLGIAYAQDGSVAARFSDTIKLDVEKKELDDFKKEPLHYENQFDIASGQYTLKVAFSAAKEAFGKIEQPLKVEPFDGKQLSLSDIALSKNVQPLTDAGLGLDAELMEGKTPLVTKGGLQIIPTGTSRFKDTEKPVIYVEVYEPMLADPTPPAVGLQLRVLDAKTGEAKQDSGVVNLANYVRAGNPVVPVGLKLWSAPLPSGTYTAELKALDSAGRQAIRTTEFQVE